MGWVSSRDPLGQMTVKFPDRESAIRFAEGHGMMNPKNHLEDILDLDRLT
jgi:hypothetical protein